MQLQFFGGVSTVTGSRTLVEGGGQRVLIDCGMFQGYKDLRLRNWEKFPIDPATIDAVVLTHAHLDHSGLIPRLVKQGFNGAIYTSRGTRALARLLLLDAGWLQEEDAAHANRGGWSKHKPALPLYTRDDAEASLKHFVDLPWQAPLKLGGLTFTLRPAGHILGASTVHVTDGGTSVLFSGDLGRREDLVMRPPVDPPDADVVVLESTYGDRDHPPIDPLDQLGAVIRRTADRGGVLLIPAFAVGRTQSILRGIQILRDRGDIPMIPVYLDSPMATESTDLYVQHADEHRLTQDEAQALWRDVRMVPTPIDSMRLDRQPGPMIVVSAAGMLTGGRVLHHLVAFGGAPENTLLFSGFQAGGTRGASILQGNRRVKVHGQWIDIGCEVDRIDTLSAHADREELVAWLARMRHRPQRVLLNHGEPGAADALRLLIEERLGWEVSVAREREIVAV